MSNDAPILCPRCTATLVYRHFETAGGYRSNVTMRELHECTPCRLGSVRGAEVLDEILAGRDVDANIALLRDLCETMKFGSLCALGGFAPYPVLSALDHWPEDFGA